MIDDLDLIYLETTGWPYFFWLKLDTFASLFRQRRSPHCRRIVGMPGVLSICAQEKSKKRKK